jgi:AcrR family transcriptional regulator
MRAETARRNAGSLRDRKKAKQREALVGAAMNLFRDVGFEKTRMEDIAAAAEVSVATVYNYFTTKQQILLAIVQKNIRDSLELTTPIAKEPPADPVAAIVAIVRADIGDMDREPDKKLWRELLASMVRDEENRTEIEGLRGLFRDNLRRLIRLLVDRGDLRKTADIEAVTDIIYAIYAYHFRQLVCIKPMKTAAAVKSIRRDITALFSGSLAPAKR